MSGGRDILTALPSIVSADILSNWVGIKSTVRVDSAYCSIHLRPDWLQVLTSPGYVLQWQSEKKNTDWLASWALKRKASLSHIVVESFSDLDLYNKYFTAHGERISTIRFYIQHKQKKRKFTAMVAAQCKNLTHLYCYGYTHNTPLNKLLTQCTLLRELYVEYFNEVRMHSHADTQWYPNIEHLESFEDEGERYSDLETVSCPSLRVVMVSNCANAYFVGAIVRTAVQAHAVLLNHCNVTDIHNINPRIGMLNICNTTLNDTHLATIVSNCTNIVHLDISGTTVTDNGVRDVVPHLTRLQTLNLSKTNVTESSMHGIAAHCTTLTELKVLWCDNILPNSVHTVLQNCPNLRSLGVDWYVSAVFEMVPNTLNIALLGNLTTLALSCKTYHVRNIMYTIAMHCTALQHFTFHIYNLESAEVLDIVVEKCTALQTLCVNIAGQSNKFVYPKDVQRWQKVRRNLVVKRNFTELWYNVNSMVGRTEDQMTV